VPELPEVETVVRDLRPLLIGRRLGTIRTGSHALRRPWSPDWTSLLKQRTISELTRRGKWIIARLDDGQHLVVHLGMTGQLTVVPRAEPRNSHTHWLVDLDNGKEQLRFRDIRRFGSVSRFADVKAVDKFFQSVGLGPEPFTLSKKYWHERLGRTERCLKAVLLDQRVVAGVGNIYADESLHQARLHPSRLACRLAKDEAERLRRAIGIVLTRAIERRGSSIRNYIGGSGLKGHYQDEFRVYGRTGEPCWRCRAKIERIRLAGRSTHFCPKCQTRRTARASGARSRPAG
jgi:formamidopyrimidine-DNA glycosylase